MTQEEKAKAYDEALEQARRIKNGEGDWRYSDLVEIIPALTEVFPNLAESEDERTRKELIGMIEECTNWEHKKEYIVYLEKQKENPKSADSIPSDCVSDVKCEDRWHKVGDFLPDNGRDVLAKDALGNYLIAHYDGDQWFISGYDNEDKPIVYTPAIKEWCDIPSERQKEQKPAENVSEEEYVKRFKSLCDAYEINLPNREYDIYHLCDDLSKLFIDSGKHNSAEWSEEDETHRAFILESLGNQIRFCKKDAEGAYYAKQIRTAQNWLKSLPLNLKKENEDIAKLCSNEWSEEDEKIANEIEEELWYPGDFPDYPSKEESELYDDCQRRLNWFKNKIKSLRPQQKRDGGDDYNKGYTEGYNKGYKDAEEYYYMIEEPQRKPSEKKYDGNMDNECIKLCDILNSIPSIDTFESCCGHLKDRYSIWFFCNDMIAISRLGRCVERNYSDGKWELLVDSTDTHPTGVFWLRSKVPFKSYDEMEKSVNELCNNIQHWFNAKFDSHFNGNAKQDYQWKPSEEQMEALDKAIPVCMGIAGREEVAPLESLYEQLKKLGVKEEPEYCQHFDPDC